MSRLSDRAFHIVKEEIDRCYSDTPQDQLERVIMLARLENLRQQPGEPISKVKLWEELSDISPRFNQQIIHTAANVDAPSPFVGISIGVGAVAVLVAAAIGVENLSESAVPLRTISASKNTLQASAGKSAGKSAGTPQVTTASTVQSDVTQPGVAEDTQPKFAKAPINAAQNSQRVLTAPTKSAFETARAFGWQAALKAQDPPHSAGHWRETATLWAQAIDLLDQVPRYDSNYTAARAKKEVYQQNLEAIQAREQEALLATSEQNNTSPQFSPPAESQLTLAKRYGWQAALASQNAPHPAQKWADISQLWQLAIQNLNQIEPQDPTYADAQQIKTQYQENLAAIRQRYQQEQNATQRLQSLQATLNEIEQSITLSSSSRKTQLAAIVKRLQTIPTNTVAHLQAQSLIERTQGQLGTLPERSPARLAVSTEAVN